jgi:putative transposase
MWRELRAQGIQCSIERLQRLRRENGIETWEERRKRLKVERKNVVPSAFNRLHGPFRVTGANRVWVGDMTFVRTRTGLLHLSILLDLYSRRIVGWAMGDRPDAALALGALGMALLQRLPRRGLIHHTDRGSPYSSVAYRTCLKNNGMFPSMGAPSTPTDNVVAERFFKSLKEELVNHADFATHETAKAAIFEYIEIFYNRQRRHSTLGYISPMEFEERGGCSFITL